MEPSQLTALYVVHFFGRQELALQSSHTYTHRAMWLYRVLLQKRNDRFSKALQNCYGWLYKKCIKLNLTTQRLKFNQTMIIDHCTKAPITKFK